MVSFVFSMIKIDLHIHTDVSDGTDSPEEILGLVKDAGIRFFSVTDHDSVKACSTILKMELSDVKFITGVEFSCEDTEGKYHILGYNYDIDSPVITNLATRYHNLRMMKLEKRLLFLKKQFGVEFPKFESDHLFEMDNPGKPHIGNLMVKYGFAKTKESAIKDFIDKVKIQDSHFSPEETISAIIAGGGIPVLAHPFYGSGDQLILYEQMEHRLRKLISYGIAGVEAFYSGFTPKLRDEMLLLAKKYELYVTAGSDYHGKNKLVLLGDNASSDVEQMPEEMKRFLRKVRCLI